VAGPTCADPSFTHVPGAGDVRCLTPLAAAVLTIRIENNRAAAVADFRNRPNLQPVAARGRLCCPSPGVRLMTVSTMHLHGGRDDASDVFRVRQSARDGRVVSVPPRGGHLSFSPDAATMWLLTDRLAHPDGVRTPFPPPARPSTFHGSIT